MTRSPLFKPLVALGVGLAIGLLAWIGLGAGVLQGAGLRLQDDLYPTGGVDPRIVVVAIDDRSLASLGRWPWDRDIHARLIEAIARGRPEVIGYDVAFPEPSADRRQDLDLAAALRAAGNVILVEPAIPRGKLGSVPKADQVEPPTSVLAVASAAVAHPNVIPDPDGVVRSVPMLINGPGFEQIPALSLALYERVAHLQGPLTIRPDGLQIDRAFVPTGGGHLLNVTFPPPRPQQATDLPASAFPTYRAEDVINGTVPSSALSGKVVLIGATAIGLGDFSPTPLNKSQREPGVFVHADALNTMLTGDYVLPAGRAWNALAAALLASIVALAVLFLPVVLAVVISLAGGFGYLMFVFSRFDGGRFYDMVYPSIGLVLAFIAALSVKYFTEVRRRRQVSRLFGQYVPESAAQQLVEARRLDSVLAGERLEVTVLFCDLRGFTAMSSRVSPATVREVLEVYYRHTSPLVLEHGGTLLQYVGDEVFAVFGAPVPRADHSKAAFACAMAFQRQASKAINEELQASEQPRIKFGIGLNSGEVVAGHFGSAVRRQYTVIGDPVNVGARLCAQASPGEIVMSEDVRRAIEPPEDLVDMGVPQLKGVSREFHIYRVPPPPWIAELVAQGEETSESPMVAAADPAVPLGS